MSNKNELITRLNVMVSPLTESDLHSKFDDSIDEETQSVVIAGVEFIASKILNEMDPIAYNEAFSNWMDQSGDYVEIDGSYYLKDEAEDFLEELRDELEESIGEAEEEGKDPDKEEVDLLAEVERVLDTCF
jgi:hypothetical protein